MEACEPLGEYAWLVGQIRENGRVMEIDTQGEHGKGTFNYIDLSTICHNFLQHRECEDFVLYYFNNEYAWNLFPEDSRERMYL